MKAGIRWVVIAATLVIAQQAWAGGNLPSGGDLTGGRIGRAPADGYVSYVAPRNQPARLQPAWLVAVRVWLAVHVR